MKSIHALKRLNQRGISEKVISLVIQFGQHKYTGENGKIFYINNASRKKIKDEIGPVKYSQIEKHLNTYLITSIDNSVIITVGKRYKNKRIKSK